MHYFSYVDNYNVKIVSKKCPKLKVEIPQLHFWNPFWASISETPDGSKSNQRMEAITKVNNCE